MLSYILPIAIDLIDASPFEEMTLIGVPLVAIVEAGIIYHQTGNKYLAVIGLIESVIPGVDILPFATISKVIFGKKY
ncbi:hypothetical protein GQ472_03510 [archaeon]|nr:hypothetical protein [archaeon]